MPRWRRAEAEGSGKLPGSENRATVRPCLLKCLRVRLDADNGTTQSSAYQLRAVFSIWGAPLVPAKTCG
jgi:hypothetical protein